MLTDIQPDEWEPHIPFKHLFKDLEAYSLLARLCLAVRAAECSIADASPSSRPSLTHCSSRWCPCPALLTWTSRHAWGPAAVGFWPQWTFKVMGFCSELPTLGRRFWGLCKNGAEPLPLKLRVPLLRGTLQGAFSIAFPDREVPERSQTLNPELSIILSTDLLLTISWPLLAC